MLPFPQSQPGSRFSFASSRNDMKPPTIITSKLMILLQTPCPRSAPQKRQLTDAFS